MRDIFLLVSILITIQFAHGQTGTIGSVGVNEYAPTVVADNSGNTYIGGSRNTVLWLIKRNSFGQVLWSNTIPTGLSGIGIDLNDLIMVGDTIFGCGQTRNSAGNIQGGVYFKVNANTGTCYWLKQETTSETYYASIQYYQGKLILVGSKVSYPVVDVYDGKVIAVSSTSGNLIWQTPIFGIQFTSSSADYIDDFQSSTTIENGQMFLTGRSYVDGAPVNMRPMLVGIDVDNNGSIFLSKYLTYNIATDFSRVYGTSIQRDGSELILGFMGDYLCSGCSNYRTGMVKCDLSGNVIWSKYYDITGATNEFNRNLNVTPDGYVIFGQATFGSYTRLILLKTDKNGNFLLGKSIGQNGQNLTTQSGGLYNLACASDFKNGIHHFVGNKYGSNANDRDIFYLRANNTNLEGENTCFTYQNLTVTTTVIPPFSGNLLTTSQNYPITFSTTSATTAITTSSCPNITVTQTHLGGCSSDTISISVSGLTNPTITWSNGVVGNTAIVNSLDTLYVSIQDPNTCCSYQEMVIPDFQVTSNDLVVDLPSDTVVCLPSGGTYSINAVVTSGQTGVSYSWSSGQSTQSIQVGVSGTYIVNATAGCSGGSDTIALTVNHAPTVDLGNDLQLCSSQFPYVLNPSSSPDIDTWSWSTGATSSTISISQVGTYDVEVSNECGTDTDEVVVTVMNLPSVDLVSQIDTCLSPNQWLLVNATVSGANTVVWSNGDVGTTAEFFSSGTYSVDAENNCGVLTSFIDVIINTFPEVDLGNDLELCSTQFPYVLSPSSSNVDSWLWSTGETTSSITVNQAETIDVQVSNTCGTDTDQIVITEIVLPTIDLISQIDTCLNVNQGLLVSATITGSNSILWSNGDDDTDAEFFNSGTYTVDATNSCGTVSESIDVVIGHFPQVDLGNDLELCSTELPYTLSPFSSDVNLWLWSTGETSSSIVVSQSGIIDVQVSNQCGTDADQMVITEMVLPTIDLISEIDTCLNPNQSLLVSATITGANAIVWSTGETGMETEFTQSGTYSVVASNDCGMVSESIVVGIYHPLTSALPTLIESCEGYVVLEDYISSVFEITSSDLDLSNKYVSESGWIYCSTETECGSYADSVYVDVKTSDLLYLQNTFTPNSDGVNDVFELMVPDLHVVSIEIFNRWGEIVYREEGAFSGWDGTYKGKICPDGIYQVQLVYTECRGLNSKFNGHVNLLK